MGKLAPADDHARVIEEVDSELAPLQVTPRSPVSLVERVQVHELNRECRGATDASRTCSSSAAGPSKTPRAVRGLPLPRHALQGRPQGRGAQEDPGHLRGPQGRRALLRLTARPRIPGAMKERLGFTHKFPWRRHKNEPSVFFGIAASSVPGFAFLAIEGKVSALIDMRLAEHERRFAEPANLHAARQGVGCKVICNCKLHIIY